MASEHDEGRRAHDARRRMLRHAANARLLALPTSPSVAGPILFRRALLASLEAINIKSEIASSPAPNDSECSVWRPLGCCMPTREHNAHKRVDVARTSYCAHARYSCTELASLSVAWTALLLSFTSCTLVTSSLQLVSAGVGGLYTAGRHLYSASSRKRNGNSYQNDGSSHGWMLGLGLMVGGAVLRIGGDLFRLSLSRGAEFRCLGECRANVQQT